MPNKRAIGVALVVVTVLLSLATAALDAQPVAPVPQLSDVSMETLALFRELYGFRNDRLFHQVGFDTGHKYHGWLDRLEALMENRDGWPAFSEIGIIPGDLFTLALDYMDNQGRPADSFTRDMEARLLEETEADPAPDEDDPDDAELAGVDPEWMPADYKHDGQDNLTMDGKTHIFLYIYVPEPVSLTRLIATGMQAALDTYQKSKVDIITVAVMEGPGENYPLETVELRDGTWKVDDSVVVPEALLDAMRLVTRNH